VNLNKIAKEITEMEGGKVNQSIAQIKETMKCMLEIMGCYSDKEIIQTINRYRD